MINDVGIKIIIALQRNGGLKMKELVKELSLSRTNLQYHLKVLIELNLVKKSRQGREWVYFASEDRVISGYFNQIIDGLKLERDRIVRFARVGKKDSAVKKIKLVFPNYYDLLNDDRLQLQKYYEIKDYSDRELIISQDEFVYRCKDAEVIVANWPCDITKEVIDQLPKLQYFHTTTYMYSYIDLDALRLKGIKFSHVPYTYKNIALVEYIIAQIFALLRPTVVASRQVRSGIKEFRGFEGEQLRGKTIGIVGTDYITKDLISILRGFGTEVLISSRIKGQNSDDYGINKFTDYEDLMLQADILLFASRVNEPESKIDFDWGFFSKLKKDMYLISLSKPDKIDYEALRESIYSGRIKGIALDFVSEFVTLGGMQSKNSEINKILYLPNVLITPDIGWYTSDSVKNLNKYTTRTLINYAKGNDEDLLF